LLAQKLEGLPLLPGLSVKYIVVGTGLAPPGQGVNFKALQPIAATI